MNHHLFHTCSICAVKLEPTRYSRHTGAVREVFDIPEYEYPFITPNLKRGQAVFCVRCYSSGACSLYSKEDLATIHWDFGREFYRRGMFPKAIDALLEAVKMNRSAEACTLLSHAFSTVGNRVKSLAFTQQAMELDPNSIAPVDLVRRLMNVEQFDEALACIDRYIDRVRDRASFLMLKAECLLTRGDLAEAKKCYTNARAYADSDVTVWSFDKNWQRLIANTDTPREKRTA